MQTGKNMTATEYDTIKRLLKDRIGLEPSSLGNKAVECAVTERMRLLGINSISSYADMISLSSGELAALIELVVVPETWFFRDREPFLFLANFLLAEWKPEHINKPLHILSAPCASGEEPYSIVMTCLDCGLKSNQFLVDAVDINAQSIQKAQNAVYGRNSFRGAEMEFRARHFIFDGHKFSLKPNVRSCVRFFEANLIRDDFPSAAASYDIIFCRNLLIYLHDQARLKVIAVLDRLLAPGGLLFIGHAELTPALAEAYETVNHQGSFALRKPLQKRIKPASPDARRQRETGSQSTRSDIIPVNPNQERPAFNAHSSVTGQYSVISGAADDLEHATLLANQGRLGEAAEVCERALQTDKHNAQAHFLMGLIKEARDDNRGAEQCFNRAIYLEADFTDAILHLAVLKEQYGDTAGARLLRRRAASINTQSVPKK